MKGYYINLNNRTDRKQHIEDMKETYSFFKDIERFEAIKDIKGEIGCAKSHLSVLHKLSKKNEPYYLILEDDFIILNENNFLLFEKAFNEIKNNDSWDIITLTPRGTTEKHYFINDFHKIIDSQTTSGYIIKHRFIHILFHYFKLGLWILMNNGLPIHGSIDQTWKPLQLRSKFLYYDKIFAGQSDGYSDIEKQIVNYNDRFIDQNRY
tara:strand:+ start:192 stop:815 length:624 start_codon:yes stop_codon:yes gene_type:complete